MRLFNEATGCWEQLVDATNMHIFIPQIVKLLRDENRHSKFVGFDIESQDSKRHAGLNEFMKLDAESEEYKKAKKLVFDLRRTEITGFSIYQDNLDTGYYFNAAHADVENRIPRAILLELLQIIKDTSFWIIHNAAFEIASLKASWGFDVGPNYICTMQMCVSAYNSDEYSVDTFARAGLGGIQILLPAINRAFAGYQPKTPLTAEQKDLLGKVTSKTSESAHSYNGYVRSLAYGYGLKKAVKSWFGYDQVEFETVLNGKAHMGLLTGPEVLHYGADDAYWCLALMKRVMQFMQATNPAVVQTFFRQENPMPAIWADCWVRGLRVNKPAIDARTEEARGKYARVIRDLIESMRHFKFPEYANPRMVEREAKWYVGEVKDKKTKQVIGPANKYLEYREKFKTLMSLDTESMSDYEICKALSSSVSQQWQIERKDKPAKDQLNIVHYMVTRVLYHDLMNLPYVFVKGNIQSGGEARGKLREFINELKKDNTRWIKELSRYKAWPIPEGMTQSAYAEFLRSTYQKDAALAVLDCLDKLANIEQTMKLYLRSYLLLTDPETNRMYPSISSRLNTRRMAGENPNPMQLAKRGESTFVRGFFLPERDDHVYVSVDWSQVELVLIGEESKDLGFHKAYGQLPYNDLHVGAAAAAVKVYHPDFTETDLANMRMDNPELQQRLVDTFPMAFVDPVKQVPMNGKVAYKFWRGNAGKTSNFGYWYSGSLMTVQGPLGWTDKQMWEATENYRKKFPVAEQWRMNTIEEVRAFGFVNIFDGHRRTRFEGTVHWRQLFMAKWASMGSPAITAFGELVCNSIQRRAGNQGVNAKIQGGCATLAKRSILRLYNIIKDEGWDAHFCLPIHDELIFSVQKDQAIDFSYRIRQVMCDHPDLVQWLKLDGTISVGRTLEAYHPQKSPHGQIELDEAPFIEGFLPREFEGKALPDEYRRKAVEYLFHA